MKITVIAHTNSKKPRVEKDLLDNFHVYVHEPPINGKANTAVINALAKYFHTKKSNVFFISGERAKRKVFEIPENTKT